MTTYSIYTRLVAGDPQMPLEKVLARLEALQTKAHVAGLFVMLPFTAPVGVTPTLMLSHARSMDAKSRPVEVAVDTVLALHERRPDLDIYLESALNLLAKPGLTPALEDTLSFLAAKLPFLKGILINDLPLPMRRTDPITKGAVQSSPMPLLLTSAATLDPEDALDIAQTAQTQTPGLPLLIDPTRILGSLPVTKAAFEGPLVGTLMRMADLEGPAPQLFAPLPMTQFMVMDALYE